MNPVICVLAFLGSFAAYCVIVLVLTAVKSAFLKNESPTDDDFWYDVSIVQLAIVVVVLAIYFSNMIIEVSK